MHDVDCGKCANIEQAPLLVTPFVKADLTTVVFLRVVDRLSFVSIRSQLEDL